MTLQTLPLLATATGDVWDVLRDILVLLAAALVLGTLAERLGQSVIVGYLLAGTLVGPNGLGWIASRAEGLIHIAELGVSLLLFTVGLEFSPRRLLSLGNIVLKTGPLQVIVTLVVGLGLALACGLGMREAFVFGIMVTMSSTVCVLRMLTDRVEVDSEHGRAALGILIVQDAAVIPMILLVSVMATGGSWGLIVQKLALALVLAAVLMCVFYLLFNFIVPWLLRLITWKRNRDLPVLLAVITATGSAWATQAVGLSPALGAFAAGVLLAVSPFATQIRADTRPLTTLMMTFFFASIGMFGNPAWLLGHWLVVVGVVLAIVAGKPLIIALLVRGFGRPWRYAIATGMCLAQVGEFSFVLATIAQSDAAGTALIGPDTFRVMVAATIVTLLFTPYLVAAAPGAGTRFEHLLARWRWWRRPTPAPAEQPAQASVPSPAESNVILIAGFGPAGQRVAEGLSDSHLGQMVAIDLNPTNLEIARQYGLQAHLGDATHRDILEHAGIYRAQVVVVTVPDRLAVREIILLVRDLAPQATLVVRCRYHVLHWEYILLGAHEVVDEEDQVGRRLAAQIRKIIGKGEGPTE
jgi:CPA2 family monovalent cation:H+ antiporter-2